MTQNKTKNLDFNKLNDIYLNKINPEMSKAFTPEIWWECRNRK